MDKQVLLSIAIFHEVQCLEILVYFLWFSAKVSTSYESYYV
jgi:hypothetical protein